MSQPTMIITGASYGLGAAIASLAAANGVQVVLAARSKEAVEAHADQIRQNGGKALAVTADVSRFEDCQEIIAQTMQVYGRIDALINNAAIIEPFDKVVEIQPEAWNRIMAVNVLGPLMMCQLAIPHLRQTLGRILNLTSHAAEFSIPGACAYSTSKIALNRLSTTLAIEEPTLSVILFIPGEVDTPMQAVIREKAKGKTTDDIHQGFIDRKEQGQLITPETSARSLLSLALKAPQAWSGEIFQWDDPRILELAKSWVSPGF
jgi:3-oxoacyl-[acyl-carrier protein] reductase